MTYHLDTNVGVVLLRNSSPALAARFRMIDPSGDLRACSIVVAELRHRGAAQRQAGRQSSRCRCTTRAHPSLPFDDAAADRYATIRHYLESSGQIIGSMDLQIAAIALANGCTLITNNTTEFSRVPDLLIEDWQVP